MKHRIVKHQWSGAYISDNMNYYTIEKQMVNAISIFKRLLLINNTWYDWVPLKDKKEPIHFNTYMDAYHCFIRVISGEPIGDWKEEIVS
jgi:hypothetical protein